MLMKHGRMSLIKRKNLVEGVLLLLADAIVVTVRRHQSGGEDQMGQGHYAMHVGCIMLNSPAN